MSCLFIARSRIISVIISSVCASRCVFDHHFVLSLLKSSPRKIFFDINFRNLSKCADSDEMEQVCIKFKKISQNAHTPTKGSKYAAGYDLYSAKAYIIPPLGKELVSTDLQIAIPRGHYGRIAPRSGLAWKHFIDVGAGVIDEDYRGNVGVVLFNFSNEPFKVNKGDRIAQLICEKISYPRLEEVEDIEKTDRGINGFGSTGKN